MKTKSFRSIVVGLACAGMLLQPVAMAAPQSHPITDVALQNDGMLVGTITNVQGQPLAGAPVTIMQRGKEIARVSTDQQGIFKVQDLHGGVYQVASAGQQGVFRLWAPHTAPPIAQQGLTFQAGQVVRGQTGTSTFSKVAGWVKNHPIITGGLIAAAIAIPLAIDNNDNGPSS